MKLSILILFSVVGLSVSRTDFPANYQSQGKSFYDFVIFYIRTKISFLMQILKSSLTYMR